MDRVALSSSSPGTMLSIGSESPPLTLRGAPTALLRHLIRSVRSMLKNSFNNRLACRPADTPGPNGLFGGSV